MPALFSLLLASVLSFSVVPSTPVIRSAERTPLSSLEIHQALDAGHVLARRRPASRSRLAMAWALVSYENARGRSVFDFNLGNVGPASRGAPRHLLRDGGYYASFPSPIAGATALWTLLAARCSGALRYFDAGMALEAGAALGRCGYHRTDPARYGEALRQLYGEALASFTPRSPVLRASP